MVRLSNECNTDEALNLLLIAGQDCSVTKLKWKHKASGLEQIRDSAEAPEKVDYELWQIIAQVRICKWFAFFVMLTSKLVSI